VMSSLIKYGGVNDVPLHKGECLEKGGAARHGVSIVVKQAPLLSIPELNYYSISFNSQL